VRFAPIDATLLDRTKHQSITITDRHSEVLYESLARSGARAEWLTADNLPPHVVAATLAAEDRRFEWHLGVDPIAIARAMIHNIKAMRVVEGGSTITQQVAKLLLASKSRSLKDKAREAILAARLEHRYTKSEILALYLNLAPYGNRIHGIAREREYFGCAPEQLTPAQAAFLASLPQRPSAFNPIRDPRAAHAATAHRADEAARGRLAARPTRGVALHAEPAAGARDALRRALRKEIGPHDPRREAPAHDPRHHLRAARESPRARRAQRRGRGARQQDRRVARVGRIGRLLRRFRGIRRRDRRRDHAAPAGIDAEAVHVRARVRGGRSPATVLADVPSHFPTGEDGVVYTPRNYDRRYRGPLRARAALAGSENVPAVALLHQMGSESFLRLLHNVGFTGLDRTSEYYGLGLTLGNAEVTLEQLIRGYATFARGGVPVGRREQLVSRRTAFWITDILSDPDAREYAFGSGGSLDFPFPVAVKTGTSQAYRDNWTVGYARRHRRRLGRQLQPRSGCAAPAASPAQRRSSTRSCSPRSNT
jgi:penicillin-binding protein 1C